MTHDLELDEKTTEWLALAGSLTRMAQGMDTLHPESLLRTLTDLREALEAAVPLFQANGGISLAKRATLRQIMTTREPASLSSSILREGLLEGGQQLWAIASLLRAK